MFKIDPKRGIRESPQSNPKRFAEIAFWRFKICGETSTKSTKKPGANAPGFPFSWCARGDSNPQPPDS